MTHVCYKYKRPKGFTLLEILLSVGIIALISGITAIVYSSFQVKNNIDLAQIVTAHTLRRAQIQAQTGDGDDTWGVYISSTEIIQFKGASYATRDSAFDEIYDYPSNMNRSGLQEVVFSKVFGKPSTTGTITFTTTNETRNVSVNSMGIVSYY